MSQTKLRPTIVAVCTTCGDELGTPQSKAQCPGSLLLRALERRVAEAGLPLTVEGVPCMAVCDQSVTVAFQAADAWSYVIGGVDPDRDVDDLVSVAMAIARSEYGVPGMADRPKFFRQGVICRLPPLQPLLTPLAPS